MVLGLVLPVSVVPGVFVVSVWFWRTDVLTKVITGVLLVGLGAAVVRINLLLPDALAMRLLYAPPLVQFLSWWAPAIVVQGGAWLLLARWRRGRVGHARR